ncbi:MAG: xylulokinase [Actinomycetota bacterium]
MPLVAGVDSSTQSCKVVIRDVETGAIVRSGSAKHPDGSEIDPEVWFAALKVAIENAGGLSDVEAISVGAQQHGMVALAADGTVIRPALLWNDTRSAAAANDLISEFGAENFVARTGSVPVASFTITKLRWMRDNEPHNAAKVAAVALPHDWLTWRLRGFGPLGKSELGPDFSELTTDRSDASGTGYFNSETSEYDLELLKSALGKECVLPKIIGHGQIAGRDSSGRIYAAGAGDNAAAALGLSLMPGDVAISIGTSGTVFASTDALPSDDTGTIAGFADATGRYLSIGVTLNAARILKSAADLLAVDFDELSRLALSAQPGSGGLVLVPYFEGERTPNLPDAQGSLHGMSLASSTRPNFARAFIEGMLCGLAYGLDALIERGARAERILLIGGGAQNLAVQKIASTIFGLPIDVPVVSEYVAEGASVQAAWALTGQRPNWPISLQSHFEPETVSAVRENYKKFTA